MADRPSEPKASGPSTGSQDASDEDLMARYASTGDKAAFEQLFRRWAPRVSALLSRTSGPSDQVQDLLQKTFMHLHRARADYQPSRPFRPWLYTIALNVRRENARSSGRRREAAMDPEFVPEPGVPPAVRSPDARAVRQALLKLGEAQREVVVLHWYEGLSFPEIAELLGATTTAVKVRAHRAYEVLRGLLSDLA